MPVHGLPEGVGGRVPLFPVEEADRLRPSLALRFFAAVTATTSGVSAATISGAAGCTATTVTTRSASGSGVG